MPKVVVKLTEKVIQVGGNNVVLTVNVTLEATAKGDSQLGGSAAAAVITFFSRATAKGSSTKLATLTSTIVKSGKLAVFDLNAAAFKSVLGPDESDNSVELTFDSAAFKQPQGKALSFTLRLPDAPSALSITGSGSAKEVKVGPFELGAQLTIGGSVETGEFTDVASVPLRHDNVKDDFDQKKDLCIGATLAYPTDLRVQETPFPPTPTRRLPINNDAFEILLHPSVSSRLAGVDVPTLKTHLASIFAPVFPSTRVELVPAGDARLAAWKQAGKRLFSQGVKDPTNPLVDEGHLVPFFQFWFFASSEDGSGELGSAETLAAPKFFFVAASRQKRIQQPADLPTGRDSELAKAYRNADAPSRMILLANVIAHEVGHALGLLHVQQVSASGYDIGLSGAVMAQQASNEGQFAPALKLKRLHPVHEAVLKLHYA